jgi:hypothetical protein
MVVLPCRSLLNAAVELCRLRWCLIVDDETQGGDDMTGRVCVVLLLL